MAFTRYMRYGWIGAIAAATMALTAPTYASVDRTTASTDTGWGHVYIISYSAFDRAFDFMPAAIVADRQSERDQRNEHVFKPFATKQRASRAAVRATSVAGWRSGRTRYLATG